MDITSVIIENWPKTNYFSQYMPIVIAIIALVASLYSAYLSRKAFIAAHRPYVWGSNYGVIDHEKKTIIQVPSRVACRVKNAPAKIIRMNVKINICSEQLFDHTDNNYVRFPDETSEWHFNIGKDEFQRIMNRPAEAKSELVRLVSIEYSSLYGGKIYHYKLQQSFNLDENQWQGTAEEAD